MASSAAVLRDWLWQTTCLTLTYWALAICVKEYFSRYQMWPAPLWLPAGVAMFAAITMGPRCWPGVLLGSFFTDFITFHEPAGWAFLSVGNVVAPIVAAEFLRKRFRADEPFGRVSDTLYFCLAVMLQGVLSGFLNIVELCVRGTVSLHSSPHRALEWAMSDAGGVLLVTPLLLLRHHKSPWSGPLRGRRLELVLSVVSAIFAVTSLLLESSGAPAADAGASFLVLLPLLWICVRGSLGLAYPVFVAVMTAILAGTWMGYGPFFGVAQGSAFLIFAEIAIGFSTAILLLGGASNEQRMAAEAVRQLNSELEERVEQRTAELRATQRQLEQAAFYDPLTGLPNRRLLEERFSFCAAAARRRGTRFGVILIDLDHFKRINDNLGHDAGDALLVETGCRLAAAVRECDVVARIGGDEFVVLLPETGDPSAIDAVARRIVHALSESIRFQDKEIQTTPSLGVALCPDHAITWQSAYKAADIALYEAKRRGRATYRWFETQASRPALNQWTEAPL